MSEKHYVIAIKKGIDKDQIIDELKRDTSADSSVDSSTIPDRQVQQVNNRPSNKRLFEMALTDEEATALMNDSRVGGVNEPIEWSDEFLDTEQSVLNTNYGWQRDPTGSGTGRDRDNWGLLRHIEATNVWGSNVTDKRVNDVYPYHLDGTGVDFINQEGGMVRADHQQWYDSQGVTRYQQFQWNTLPNCSGMGTTSYSGSSGHPTHCAGTVAGKDYGWAKGAKVYSLSLLQYGQSYWFDAIKEFHKAKPIDPTTGVRRPTVVNASWGYKASFTNISNIYFRGSYTGSSSKSRNYGMIGDIGNRFNAQLYSLMAEVEEMQDEGVHYFKSAGNQQQKLCYSDDVDYNNHILRTSNIGGIPAGQPVYYNRGAGNIGPDTVVCGNIDSALYNGGEATTPSSDKGPRVDVWAAGTDIVSSYNSNSTDKFNLTGTSMSTPQVCGMSALILQANPGMTPAQLRAWWHNNAKTGLLHQGSTNESDAATFFSSDRSLMNGPNRIAFFPFSGHRPVTISGGVSITQGGFN